jgi:hypothetical protein
LVPSSVVPQAINMFKFDFEVEDSAPSKIQTSSRTSEIEAGALSNNALDEYMEISLIELVRIFIIVYNLEA